MFQFPGFASKPLWIQDLDTSTDPPSGNHTVSHAVTRQEVEGGFPHSEILGSKPVRGSPRLIAAYHVLHRLSAPRHPPNALMTLDRSHDRCSLRHTTRVCSRHASRRAGHAKHHQKDLTDAPERELEDALPACRAVQHLTVPGWCPGHASLFTMSIIRRTLSHKGVVRAYEALCSGYPDARRSTPSKEWWSQTGSNRRPHACKARALPTELWPQSWACGPSLCPC